MAVPLDQWQKRIEHHFEVLANSRSASGLPLFALEHGLSSTEVDEVSLLLRDHLAGGARLSPHWLLWTIYAAERGYTYEGSEFWQSFEKNTPGWETQDRYRVSEWFLRFQESYNGFKPSGPWASHFSIIAWPITHAVLPRYLQRQFARTLYVLRFQLARLNTTEPAAIGRLVAANAYNVSTRFEQFLQQEEVVGRIVLALLQQEKVPVGEEPLLLTTLDRIVCDLTKIRNARGWLKETSRVVADRFKGLGKGSIPRFNDGLTGSGFANEAKDRSNIRPDLRLHYKGRDAWDLQIDIPSFKELAAINPEVRQFLKETRCVLNGASVKKPPGWLLSSRRQAVLRNWPDPQIPLIGFEKHNGTLAHLLESECRMGDGPSWLFRIGRDGIAREITGRIVRPGYEYVIASTKPIERLMEGMKSCLINCANIDAVYVAIPEAPSGEYAEWLKPMNIELARTIRVWPAGFPGRRWDGEGRSEWLTTDKPIFGIIPDHIVETYEISLNGEKTILIRAARPGTPTFIQLPELPAGRHLLTIRAKRGGAVEKRQMPHEGFLELRVREPVPWMPNTASHSGLIASGTPYDAPLSTFWENEFDLSVFGPPSRQVTPRVILQNASEETIFESQVCEPQDLPITPDIWKERFFKFLRRERCEWQYLEASSGLLQLDGGDLGCFVIRFEHHVRPLRWVLCQSEDSISVRLVDETSEKEIKRLCYHFDMERPLSYRRLEIDAALEGVTVGPPGGLFVAKAGKNFDAIVVSHGLTGQGLEGLGVQPDHGHISDTPKSIQKLITTLRYWHKARVAGYLAGARRSLVTVGLMHDLVGTLAGWDWAHAEAQLEGADDIDGHMDRLQSRTVQRSGFASAVRLNAPTVQVELKDLSSWFADTAKRYQISSDEALCQFAIEFAARPQELPILFRADLAELIRRARGQQTLLRGARLAVFSRMIKSGQPPTRLPETDS